jgi:hypothetical protein
MERRVGKRGALQQGCTNPGHQVAVAIKFYIVVPSICGTSVPKLFLVTLLAPRILRWLPDFQTSVYPWFSVTLTYNLYGC